MENLSQESSEEMKNKIIEFCTAHNFEYESSKELLELYLTALIEKSKIEQMGQVSHLFKNL